MALTTIKTTRGIITGKNENGCAVFKGIPYAKPPVGPLRLMPPEEAEPWEGVRECFSFGPSPIQAMGHGPFSAVTGEDCLTVNVWTPAETTDEKLPVMFWIYGGGFQGGSSANPEFDGTKLAQKGVVVVTVNYRNGVLGFFAHPELARLSRYGASGNYGILDQIAALKWVQKNISAFGGDPDCVTIFGQSAGGISCRILLTSPEARGLFHRVIIESGGGLNEADPIRPMGTLMDISQRAMDRLGWTLDDVLSGDAAEVNEKLSQAAKDVVEGFEIGIFQPCVDGIVIPEIPGVAVAEGNYPENLDIICGSNSGDSWMFCRKVCKDLGENDAILRGFSYSPSQAWAKNQAAQHRKPIHAYYFERTQPPHHRFGGDGIYRYGLHCPHASEIVYVFGTLRVKFDSVKEEEDRLSEVIRTYWTNFAKYGDPNGEGLPVWPVYTEEQPVTLHVSDNGIAAENIVDAPEGAHVIAYTWEHPGMLESLEGF